MRMELILLHPQDCRQTEPNLTDSLMVKVLNNLTNVNQVPD